MKIKQDWQMFNMDWFYGEDGISIKELKMSNLLQRVFGFVRLCYINPIICEYFGHKWEDVCDYDGEKMYVICTRCGVDTEPPIVYM